MPQYMSDETHKKSIVGYCEAIEFTVQFARRHMQAGTNGNPAEIRRAFKDIAVFAQLAQNWSWPDPSAKAAQAAKQDAALQKLIKRASKPTPIRANKKTPI